MKLLKSQRLTLILGLAAFILVLANSYVWFFRLDLTSSKVYSINEVSKRVVSEAEGPIEFNLYLSSELTSKRPEFKIVEDLVTEYVGMMNGKITLNRFDPKDEQGFSEAVNLGINVQNLSIYEKTRASNSQVVAGLQIKMLDKQQVIPFIADPGLLEYNIAKILKDFKSSKPFKLGLLNGMSAQGGPNGLPWYSYQIVNQYLSQFYSVQAINPGEEIPADVDVLLAVKIDNLGIEELSRIEDFALSGKGVFLAVDPYTISQEQGLFALPASQNSELYKMLDSWGVKVEQKLLMDTNYLQVLAMKDPYYYWLGIASGNVNKETIIGTLLGNTGLLWASPVSITEGPSNKVLFSTSTEAKALEGPQNVDLNQTLSYIAANASAQKYNLAVALTGPLTSYTNGKSKTKINNLKTDKSKIVVVGDGDFFSDLINIDLFRTSNIDGNLPFIANSVIWLAGDEDLIALGSKSGVVRPLDKILNSDARQAAEDWIIIVNAVLIPTALVGVALFRRYRRSSKVLNSGVQK